MEEKKDFMPEMTKDIIASVSKSVKKFCQELTITKVDGTCPYGHKEGEQHIVTATYHGGICGALWQSNHSSFSSIHYGGSIAWEKDPRQFTALCPEMGKVRIQVKATERIDSSFRKKIEFKDMTGKGFNGLDKYRTHIEILDVGHHCMHGLKAGQKHEVDLFNMGEVCGFLYWGAYQFLQVLYAGGNPPWEPDPDIAHGVCPDIYNQVVYRIVREKR